MVMFQKFVDHELYDVEGLRSILTPSLQSTPSVKFIVPAHDTRLYRYLSGMSRLQKIWQGLVVGFAKCPTKITQPPPRKMLVKSNVGAVQLKHRIPRFLA